MAGFLLVIAADVLLLASMPACVHVPVGFGCGKRNKKVCVLFGGREGLLQLPTYLLRYVSVFVWWETERCLTNSQEGGGTVQKRRACLGGELGKMLELED